MLRRSLAGLVPPGAFEAADVKPDSRAEDLDVYAWGRLAAAVRTPAVGRPAMARPAVGRPAMGRPAMGRPAMSRAGRPISVAPLQVALLQRAAGAGGLAV